MFLTISDNTITIAGVVPVGSHSFTITATNTTGYVTQNFTLTVTVAEPVTHDVSVSITGNDTAITSPTTAAQGVQVTLTATPNGNNRFVRWEVVSGGIALTLI